MFRSLAWLLALCTWVAGAPSALAQDYARELAQAGVALAKDNQFGEAIVKFKAANAVEASPEHDCYIAAAYVRLKRWGQAALFTRRCTRWPLVEEKVPWYGRLTEDVKKGLKQSGYGRVEVSVVPADAPVELRVSAFAADETFSPGTIFLAPGTHTIELRSDSRRLREEVEVAPGSTYSVSFDLTPPPPPPPLAIDFPVWETAGALAAGGVIFHVLALRNQRRLEEAPTPAEYRRHEAAYDWQRVAAYACYGLAAAAAGLGTYVWLQNRDAADSDLRVGAAPLPGGLDVSLSLDW